MFLAKKLVHERFLENAVKMPDRTCFVIEKKSYSYSKVANTAKKWANALVNQNNNQPLKRIGIFGYKSEEVYISILSSLLIGATFVPLNPKFPKDKLSEILLEANLDAIIVDINNFVLLSEIVEQLDGKLAKTPTIFCPNALAINESIPDYSNDLNRNIRNNNASSIAYIMFTSGSTGKPKGVPISHENLNHFLDFCQQKYEIRPNDRLTQTFDHTFDLAIFDIFMAWSNGACFYVMKDLEIISPIKFINENKITVWFSVPSVISLLIKQGILKSEIFPTLRLSLFCGEPLYKKHAELWEKSANNSKVENLYGPTELTIACASYTFDPKINDNGNIVPIGKVFDGMSFKIIGEDGEEKKLGEIGELCISGPQTFKGYINNIDATRENLVKFKSSEKIFYRTGDLVKELEDLNLIYIGRKDTQIKINGYRIECGEIEAKILENSEVSSAAVLPWPVENNINKGIVAFILGEDIKLDELNKDLEKKLPWYMHPNEFIILDEFPLNSNGKIDRNSLKNSLEKRNLKNAN